MLKFLKSKIFFYYLKKKKLNCCAQLIVQSDKKKNKINIKQKFKQKYVYLNIFFLHFLKFFLNNYFFFILKKLILIFNILHFFYFFKTKKIFYKNKLIFKIYFLIFFYKDIECLINFLKKKLKKNFKNFKILFFLLKNFLKIFRKKLFFFFCLGFYLKFKGKLKFGASRKKIKYIKLGKFFLENKKFKTTFYSFVILNKSGIINLSVYLSFY